MTAQLVETPQQTRISARAAYQEALWEQAVIVDIRSDEVRAAEGEVHPRLGPLVVNRFALEWRFDPRSETRLPEASYDARVVVLSQEGTASSLAAEALRRLGIVNATDVVGGFAGWRADGMPVTAPVDAADYCVG